MGPSPGVKLPPKRLLFFPLPLQEKDLLSRAGKPAFLVTGACTRAECVALIVAVGCCGDVATSPLKIRGSGVWLSSVFLNDEGAVPADEWRRNELVAWLGVDEIDTEGELEVLCRKIGGLFNFGTEGGSKQTSCEEVWEKLKLLSPIEPTL